MNRSAKTRQVDAEAWAEILSLETQVNSALMSGKIGPETLDMVLRAVLRKDPIYVNRKNRPYNPDLFQIRSDYKSVQDVARDYRRFETHGQPEQLPIVIQPVSEWVRLVKPGKETIEGIFRGGVKVASPIALFTFGVMHSDVVMRRGSIVTVWKDAEGDVWRAHVISDRKDGVCGFAYQINDLDIVLDDRFLLCRD